MGIFMLSFSKEDNLLLLPFLTELEVAWLLGEEIKFPVVLQDLS